MPNPVLVYVVDIVLIFRFNLATKVDLTLKYVNYYLEIYFIISPKNLFPNA
jgi:hypothetical protein